MKPKPETSGSKEDEALERAFSQVIEDSQENVFLLEAAMPAAKALLVMLLCKETQHSMLDGTGATGCDLQIGVLQLSMSMVSRSS